MHNGLTNTNNFHHIHTAISKQSARLQRTC